VTDADGGSDTVNFIFNVFGDPNIDLNGTVGRDVLFNTGYNDTFTGGPERMFSCSCRRVAFSTTP
jgi:hypothetical protein